MVNLLPVLGLVAPPIIYLVFFGVNSSAFSAIGLSGNNMLMGVGFITGWVWIWSAGYARSVNKFFTKRDKGDFKKSFGVQSVSELARLLIWLFAGIMYDGTGNPFTATTICLLIMFLCGNALRLWLTSIAFDVEMKTAANANKVNLIVDTVGYGLVTLMSLILGGVL
jgi:hypothetical protein